MYQANLSCFEWKQKKNQIKAVEKLSAAMLRWPFEGFVQVALNAPDVEIMRTLVTLIHGNVVWDLQYCAVDFPTALSVYIHGIFLFRSGRGCNPEARCSSASAATIKYLLYV